MHSYLKSVFIAYVYVSASIVIGMGTIRAVRWRPLAAGPSTAHCDALFHHQNTQVEVFGVVLLVIYFYDLC